MFSLKRAQAQKGNIARCKNARTTALRARAAQQLIINPTRALANYLTAVSGLKPTPARVPHISGNLVLRHAQATLLRLSGRPARREPGRRTRREPGGRTRREPGPRPLPPSNPLHRQPLRLTRSVQRRAWGCLATSTFWEVPRRRAIFWRPLGAIVQDVHVQRTCQPLPPPPPRRAILRSRTNGKLTTGQSAASAMGLC